MFDRICFPKVYADDQATQKLYSFVNDYFNMELIQTTLSDIEAAIMFIIGSIATSFILGFIWMIVMKKCAAILTWVTIFGSFFALCGLTYTLYAKSEDTKTENKNLKEAGKDEEMNFY